MGGSLGARRCRDDVTGRLVLMALALSGCREPAVVEAARPPAPPEATAIAPAPDPAAGTSAATGPVPSPTETTFGFAPAERFMSSDTRIGDTAVRLSCSRAGKGEAETIVDGQVVPFEPLVALLAQADARPAGERWPPLCVDWAAGSRVDDLWAVLHLPLKYGAQRDPHLWRRQGGAWISRPITRARTHGVAWTEGRVVTAVRHRPGERFVDVYSADPSDAPPLAHYALEILGPKGPLPGRLLEHRVVQRCADGSFGSRLVEPFALAASPDGYVYAFGHDCRSTKEPIVVAEPGPVAMESWAPGGGKSRWHELPAPAVRWLSVTAVAADELWARGQEEPYLARFDGQRWTSIEAPGDGMVRGLEAAPEGEIWLVDGAGVLFRRSSKGDFERVPSPRADELSIVATSSDASAGYSLRIQNADGAWSKAIRPDR